MPQQPGLGVMNDTVILVEERVRAFEAFCDIKNTASRRAATALYRYRLRITALFGQQVGITSKS